MWKTLDYMAARWHERNVNRASRKKSSKRSKKRPFFEESVGDDDSSDDERDEKALAKSMRHGVQYAKNLWEQTKVYRISDAVMMAEKQVVMRLFNEGFLPHLKKLNYDTLEMSFLLRRIPFFNQQFASAVAKRLCTERICVSNKASIQVCLFSCSEMHPAEKHPLTFTCLCGRNKTDPLHGLRETTSCLCS